MPVTIAVRLRHGRYDAGGERPSNVEWPPHPVRVFCALAASAEGDAEWAALRWLESQARPQVWADAAEEVVTGESSGWVVENALSPKRSSQTWPGRKNGMRIRSHSTSPRPSGRGSIAAVMRSAAIQSAIHQQPPLTRSARQEGCDCSEILAKGVR